MKNKYGIDPKVLDEIRRRDQSCVYCGVFMPAWKDRKNHSDFATIEHVYPPGNDPTWVSFCCNACNLRHKMPLPEWFKTEYCREKGINEKTVADIIKKFLASGLKECHGLWLDGREHDFLARAEWRFAKTMPEIPHEYVVRENLDARGQKSFDKITKEIAKSGYDADFFGKKYRYGNYYGYKYWVIENILNREKL